MKKARTKFVVALVLFVVGISCGLLLIRYIAVNSPGKSSMSSTVRAEVDGYLLGVILLQIVAMGINISYMHDSRKLLSSLEKRDRIFRFVSWLLVLAGIFATLVYALLLLLLNG